MNEQQAFCPKCKRETVFVKSVSASMCMECGFRTESGERYPMSPSSAPTALKSVLGVLAVVALIMVAIVVVGAAVLFVGCTKFMKDF